MPEEEVPPKPKCQECGTQEVAQEGMRCLACISDAAIEKQKEDRDGK